MDYIEKSAWNSRWKVRYSEVKFTKMADAVSTVRNKQYKGGDRL